MYDFINSPFVIVSILVLGLGGIYLLACLLVKLLEKTKPAESSNNTNNYPHVLPRDSFQSNDSETNVSQTNTTSGTDDFSNANTNTNASTNSGEVSNSTSNNSRNGGSKFKYRHNGLGVATVAVNSSSSSASSSGGSSGGGLGR